MIESLLVFLFWFIVLSGCYSMIILLKRIIDFPINDELEKKIIFDSSVVGMIVCLIVSFIQFISSFMTSDLSYIISPGKIDSLNSTINLPHIPSFFFFFFIFAIIFVIKRVRLGLSSKKAIIVIILLILIVSVTFTCLAHVS